MHGHRLPLGLLTGSATAAQVGASGLWTAARRGLPSKKPFLDCQCYSHDSLRPQVFDPHRLLLGRALQQGHLLIAHPDAAHSAALG